MIALALAALALPVAPAAAAGRGGPAVRRDLGTELWARLGQIGDWLRTVFLSVSTTETADYTSYIDPNGGNG